MADSKNFIKGAIKRPGALTAKLGKSKKTGKIPVSKIKSAAKKPGLLGKQARFAMVLRGIAAKRKKS